MRPRFTPMRPVIAFCLASLLAACSPVSSDEPVAGTPPGPSPASSSSYPGEATRIGSEADARRLLENKGLTLQWIDWNTRGSVAVSRSDGLWSLRGAQAEAGGPGRLFLDGTITEIGSDYFTFDGTIRINDTPDRGRVCEETKSWHFAITQNRPYYRLREFEWCDGLTDYIDIYF